MTNCLTGPRETQLLIQRSDELPRERARIETYLKKARAKGYETHVLRPSRGCYIASVSRDHKILKTFSVIDRKGSEVGGALTGGRVTDAYAQCFMGSYLAHLGLVDVMKMSGEAKFHRGEDGILDYTHAAWAVVAGFGDEKLHAGQDMAAAIDHVKTAGYQSCLKREERNLSCEADRAEILQLSHRFGVRGVRINSSANKDAEEKLKEYALRGCETHTLGYSVKTFDKEPEIEFH